jgi:hypothetical protein
MALCNLSPQRMRHGVVGGPFVFPKPCDQLSSGEADWGGHFRSRNIATLVAIRRKCTGHILKLSDTRRCPLAVSDRTSKSNLYDNNKRKCQDNGHLSMARSLSIRQI